jgi:hypothetical protein
MACYIPIEDRYNCRSLRNRQMHHVWAATAAAVVSAGVSAYGAIESSNAAKKAADDQKKAGQKLSKAQKKAAEKFAEETESIELPKWDLARDIKEAGQVTDYNAYQLEKIFPGARNQREISARATKSYLRGEIPQDVQESIMRSVAELGGAGFSPSQGMLPGGFQAPQGLLSRQLGLTSLDLQQMGMGAAQSWQSMAGAFIESPIQLGQSRLNFQNLAADVQLRRAAGEAGLEIGAAQSAYESQTQTIGANLAAKQAQIQGIQGIGSAVSGGLTGYGSAISARNAASNVNYGGQTYGDVKGYGGKTYSPALTDTGALYYRR